MSVPNTAVPDRVPRLEMMFPDIVAEAAEMDPVVVTASSPDITAPDTVPEETMFPVTVA